MDIISVVILDFIDTMAITMEIIMEIIIESHIKNSIGLLSTLKAYLQPGVHDVQDNVPDDVLNYVHGDVRDVSDGHADDVHCQNYILDDDVHNVNGGNDGDVHNSEDVQLKKKQNRGKISFTTSPPSDNKGRVDC